MHLGPTSSLVPTENSRISALEGTDVYNLSSAFHQCPEIFDSVLPLGREAAQVEGALPWPRVSPVSLALISLISRDLLSHFLPLQHDPTSSKNLGLRSH